VLPRKHPNQKSPSVSAHLYVDVSPARTKQRPYLSIRPYWIEIRTVKFLYTVIAIAIFGMLIAFLWVLWQTLKASKTNPVDVLQKE
jgi:hypothetical protein